VLVMRISGHHVESIIRAFGRENRKTDSVQNSQENSSTHKARRQKMTGDTVNLSRKAEEMKIARKEYDRLPDIRKELVADIKERVESGSYNVKNEELAEEILKNNDLDWSL